MSAFLSHMLDRHRGGCELVQPRGRTRFEMNAGERAAELSVRAHAGNAADSNSDNTLPHADALRTEPVGLALAVTEETMSRLTRTETQQKAMKAVDHQVSLDAGQYKRTPEGKLSEEASEHTKANSGRFAAELNQQISSALAQLTNRRSSNPPVTSDLSPTAKTQMVIADAAEAKRTVRPAQATQVLEISDQPPRPSSDEIQRVVTPWTVQGDKPSAPLEPPPWLLALQTEFNQRWRDINAKATAEPVVNVTIGRIEVRAIQAVKASQPQRENKPGGVMSLDVYLKQRERRGPA